MGNESGVMKIFTRLIPALLLLTVDQAENALTSSDLVSEALKKKSRSPPL